MGPVAGLSKTIEKLYLTESLKNLEEFSVLKAMRKCALVSVLRAPGEKFWKPVEFSAFLGPFQAFKLCLENLAKDHISATAKRAINLTQFGFFGRSFGFLSCFHVKAELRKNKTRTGQMPQYVRDNKNIRPFRRRRRPTELLLRPWPNGF